MEIWNDHTQEWKTIYAEIRRTTYSVQQADELLRLGEVRDAKGEDEQITRACTVYTCDTVTVEGLLEFMRTAFRCRLSCEECFKAVGRSLIDRSHKQISLPRLYALIDRLEL